MPHRLRRALLAAVPAALLAAPAAHAATLSVDDDRAQCPAAPYTSVQAAIDAAAPGDVVAICPGTYVEGSGAVGTNALTIAKDLTLRGAGADRVTITPRATSLTASRIGDSPANIRNGVGDVVAVTGTPTQPLDVTISGITVDGRAPDGRPVAVEAGIVFLDAEGAIDRVRVTNVVTSEGDEAYRAAGGYRNAELPGYGIAHVTAATVAPLTRNRTLAITSTRVDRFNRAGVLIDAATGDAPPLTSSGVPNRATLVGDQVVGRTECVNFAATGNCAVVGLLTTGPLFGQDGIRVTAGAGAAVSSSLVSQNLVNGTGAPTRGSTDNNANLRLGAGVRLLGATTSSITRSNVVDNAYGVLNTGPDGSTETGVTRVSAKSNWWGLNYLATTNPGPAIAPTTNPQIPENPVNGTAATGTDPATGQTGPSSSLVDFFPYRNGPQSSPDSGQYPVLDAPLPADDAAPTVTGLAVDPASAVRGTEVTVRSAPADDFGVASVTYTAGSATATATQPPYEAKLTLPADAPCDADLPVTALVTDSGGQTATATTAVRVTCPAPPTDTTPTTPTSTTPAPTTSTPAPPTPVPPAPVPPVPAAPALGILVAPRTIPATGRTLKLLPNAPAGVARIEVSLGARRVCLLTGAPFSCRIVPTGADVGRQAITATLVDGLGRTAVATAQTTIPRLRARGLTLRLTQRSLPGARVRTTVVATLRRPTGVTAAQACGTGRVTLRVTRAGASLLDRQVKLSRRTCSVTRRITAPRAARKLVVTARFGGNAVLLPTATVRRSR